MKTNDKSFIRPNDKLIRTPTMTYMDIGSSGAIRRLMNLAFRDAQTILDITYGDGEFWDILPPYMELATNDIKEDLDTDLHLDFTDTNLRSELYDVVVFDPPHLADAGITGIMRERYGTVRGTDSLRRMIVDGAKECWRISRVGIIVKVTDHSHGGEFLQLSTWVSSSIPMPLYCVLHTFRASNIIDPKHKAERVPRNNGSTYLVFRKDSHKHKDFDKLYSDYFNANL